MSEKTRKKKDGEDKNKNNQRMREADAKSEKNNEASSHRGDEDRSKGMGTT
jgi:hypothetical protein